VVHAGCPSYQKAHDQGLQPVPRYLDRLNGRDNPLVAHCHLGLGRLYRRTGDRPKATEHLATATAMYREMEMGFWLENAEAEMREYPRPQPTQDPSGGRALPH
jgi:hypothetical protein